MKLNKIVATILLIWVCCGFAAWGLTLGHFTHKYPYMVNTDSATFMAIGGPFGLFATLIGEQPYHWLVKPKTVEERWQIYHAKFPNEPRSEFEQLYD